MDIRHLLLQAAAVAAVWLLAACGESDRPAGPTPVPDPTVTTVAGGSWSGSILLGDGATTPFNMTLIARGLGMTTGAARQAQAPGTTEVTGQFETGAGLEGHIEGLLEGTLQNGTFRGTLTSVAPACAREYEGPITESTVAWVPKGSQPPGCPLTFSIQLPRPLGPGCQYGITLTRQTFSGNGGTGELTIGTGPGCTWAAESLEPWLEVNDPEPKVGSGSVTFTAHPNQAGSRQGRLRVANANQTFVIIQGPSCTYSVSPLNVSLPAAGGSAAVTVTAAAGCEWSAQASVPWIAVTPASGAGSATVTVTVQATPGPLRTATLALAGQTVTVSQGSGCELSVSPSAATIAAAGVSDVLAVDAVAGCAWTAQSGVPWIVLGTTAGTGPGTIGYSVRQNTGPQRQGTVTVGARTITITQLSGCTYTVTPTAPPAFPSTGGDSRVDVVTSGTACEWTAEIVSGGTWLTFSDEAGPIRRTGSGIFSYTVATNEGDGETQNRSGVIQVTGDGAITFAIVITQFGAIE